MFRSIRSNLAQTFKREGDVLSSSRRQGGTLLRQDLRYALRSLRATPGFTLGAVLSFGFGIGAATTIFSAVDAVDLRPLPFPNQDRLVWLAEVTPQDDALCSRCASQTSAQTASDWFGRLGSVDAVGAIDLTSFEWLHGDVIASALAVRATPGLLGLLGVSPILGRDFVAADTLGGAQATALLSYELWQERFGADPAILGRRLGTTAPDGPGADGVTIVGILPSDFRIVGSPAVWLPFRLATTTSRSSRNVVAVARLRPGTGLEQASAELTTVTARLRAEYPSDYGGWGARAEPIRTYLKQFASKGRFLLLGITGLVMFIGALNVTGLLLARASARRYEFALRSALGADRGRIVRQVLVEGATLGLAGGVAGGLFSVWGTQFVSGWLRIEATGLEVGIDARVLAFALTLSLVVGIAASLLPALRASRTDLASDLATNVHVRGGLPPADARSNAVLVGQVALGLVLLTASTILSSEYLHVRYFDLGYDPRDLYTTAATATREQRSDGYARWKSVAEVAQVRVAAIPGVQWASMENVSAVHPQVVRPEGSAGSTSMIPPVKVVGRDYFRAWGMRLVAGRFFTDDDHRVGASPVVIVNEDAATAFWPHRPAIGGRVLVGDSGSVGELLTVVGIVRSEERGQLVERDWPMLYRPFAQAKLYAPGVRFAIRADSEVPSVLAAAERELRDVIGRRVRPFQSELDLVRDRFVAQRLNAMALNFFAVFGVFLVAVGLYASVAYAVSRRLSEVAVRMAFGADPGSVLRLFAQNSVIVVTKGVGIGIVGAVAITKALPGAASNTSQMEYIVPVSVMIVVTLVATYVAMRRAVALDPVETLRGDL